MYKYDQGLQKGYIEIVLDYFHTCLMSAGIILNMIPRLHFYFGLHLRWIPMKVNSEFRQYNGASTFNMIILCDLHVPLPDVVYAPALACAPLPGTNPPFPGHLVRFPGHLVRFPGHLVRFLCRGHLYIFYGCI